MYDVDLNSGVLSYVLSFDFGVNISMGFESFDLDFKKQVVLNCPCTAALSLEVRTT